MNPIGGIDPEPDHHQEILRAHGRKLIRVGGVGARCLDLISSQAPPRRARPFTDAFCRRDESSSLVNGRWLTRHASKLRGASPPVSREMSRHQMLIHFRCPSTSVRSGQLE